MTSALISSLTQATMQSPSAAIADLGRGGPPVAALFPAKHGVREDYVTALLASAQQQRRSRKSLGRLLRMRLFGSLSGKPSVASFDPAANRFECRCASVYRVGKTNTRYDRNMTRPSPCTLLSILKLSFCPIDFSFTTKST